MAKKSVGLEPATRQPSSAYHCYYYPTYIAVRWQPSQTFYMVLTTVVPVIWSGGNKRKKRSTMELKTASWFNHFLSHLQGSASPLPFWRKSPIEIGSQTGHSSTQFTDFKWKSLLFFFKQILSFSIIVEKPQCEMKKILWKDSDPLTETPWAIDELKIANWKTGRLSAYCVAVWWTP